MIESFKALVKESNQIGKVDEMGVKNPERLSGSEMGRIRRDTLAHKPFADLSKQVADKFRSIRRLDITMERPANSRTFYPRFPEDVVELLNQLYNLDRNKAVSQFGKWRDVYPNDSDAIQFRIEAPSDFQRSHFPNNGIPNGLRGTGLGYKLYRTLLKFAGYISSNTSGTTEKDRAWGSMLSYKPNPDGSPSSDDAYAIIGSGRWMAIDKTTLPQDQIIDVATNFISSGVGWSSTKPDKFDIDDELLALLPNNVLSRLTPEYLTSLKTENRITEQKYDEIVASQGEALRREREERERHEAEARAQVARQEAETRQRLAARITQFGAEPDEDWELGDFIVVKQYLYQADYSGLPIRKVVNRNQNRDGTIKYTAVKVSEAIRFEQGNVSLTNLQDTRTTTDKSEWIKVNVAAIPDLSAVNLSREEKEYIKNYLRPEDAQARAEQELARVTKRTEAERIENAPRAEPTQRAQTLGITVASNGNELKEWITVDRPNTRNLEMLKRFRQGDFTKFIILGPDQMAGFRQPWGIPVFGAYTGSGRNMRSVDHIDQLTADRTGVRLINLVTGFEIEPPFSGLGLQVYPLTEVTEDDKLRARPGDHFYIANHQNSWGIIGETDYGTRNTIEQKFIYIRAYGYGQRSIAVRLDLLRKIGTPVTI